MRARISSKLYTCNLELYAFILVLTKSGDRCWMVIPNLAYSARSAIEKLFTYAFVAAYTVIKGSGCNSDPEETLTTAPCLRFFICPITNRVISVVAPTFMLIMSHKSCSGTSPRYVGYSYILPTLLTWNKMPIKISFNRSLENSIPYKH